MDQSPPPRAATATGVVIAELVVVLSVTPVCLAAGPVKGGRYAGKWSTGSGKEHGLIMFNVDDQGRAFVSDPRLVFEGSQFNGPCAEAGMWDLGGSQRNDLATDTTTVSDGTPVRIRPRGSFFLSVGLTRGHTSARLRLRGRSGSSGRVATGSFIDSGGRPGGGGV